MNNKELLRKAQADREEYFANIEEKQKIERLRLIADKEWEESKSRIIIDLEDQVNALISKNVYFEREIRFIFNQNEVPNQSEVDRYKDQINQNEYKIYQLRCEMDDVRYQKRPKNKSIDI